MKTTRDKRTWVGLTIIILLILVIFPIPIYASVESMLATAAGWISIAILKIVSYITYLSGTILNFVIKYTVVQMKQGVDAAGIGEIWGVIRDVANMGFIFVLLYAGVTTILGMGQDNKKLIVNVVVAAILINFSLFFTRLFIDATNVIALLFYGAMVPASALSVDQTSLLTNFDNAGLANAIMDPLKITSIWQASGSIVDSSQLLIIGVLGSVIALIAAFVFFAIAIMFVIRFVVLMFTMVLSPLAFLAMILPQAKKYRDQWWNALSGQAIFAPVYFLLTWIVIMIATKLPTSSGNMAGALGALNKTVTNPDGTTSVIAQSDPTSIGLIVNFMVIIALLIASLIAAKEWAGKAGSTVTGITKWATGQAGKATFGLAGYAGRGTIGRFGAAVGNSEYWKKMAANEEGKYGKVGEMTARLALIAGRKTAQQSFDLRGTGLGKSLDAGKAGGKGGFAEYRKKKAEDEAKFATSLGPSDELVDRAEQELDEAKRERGKLKQGSPEYVAANEKVVRAQNKLDNLKGVKADERKKELKKEMESSISSDENVKKEGELNRKIQEVEQKRREAESSNDAIAMMLLGEELEQLKKEKEVVSMAAEQSRKKMKEDYDQRIREVKDMKGQGDKRKKAYANIVESSVWASALGYNRAAAAKIRKGKSEKDKLAEAAKKVFEDEQKEKGGEEEGGETSGKEAGGGEEPKDEKKKE